MSKQCPNKNSAAWKDLVVYAGSEERAYALYIANNYNIPPVTKLEEEGVKKGVKEKTPVSMLEPLIQKTTEETERLNKILARKLSDLKTSKDKPTLSKEIQQLKNQIKDLESSIVVLRKEKALEAISKYAEEDLQNTANILNKYETDGIDLNELNSTLKSISLWQKAGDFSNDDHLFLTPEQMEELDNPENEGIQKIRLSFLQWKSDADRLYNRYMEISKDLIEKELQEEFGDDVEADLDKVMKDVNIMFKNMIDISEVDNSIFQLMSQWVRKANFNAYTDTREDFENVEKVFDNLKSKKKFDRFIELVRQRQSNEDSRRTGDMVFRFTQKWFDQEKGIYRTLRNSLEAAENEVDIGKKRAKRQKAYKTFREKIDKITLTIDGRQLFYDSPAFKEYYDVAKEEFSELDLKFNKETEQVYIEELKKQLGEEGFNFYKEQLREKIDSYITDEAAQREYLEDTLEGDLAAIEIAMDEWKLKYNPFWNAHYSIEGFPNKKIGNSWASSSKQYISIIAQRYGGKGEDLGFYDDNFRQLMSDSDMKEAYELVTGIFSEYVNFLPPHETQMFQVNSLPSIQKSILEVFAKDGMTSGLHSLWNSVKESTRTDLFDKEIPSEINDKFVQLDFLTDNSSVISEYVTTKSIQYKLENPGYSPEELASLKEEWTKDIKNELAAQKSWDIERITKAFMLHSSTYKHKTKIEDSMKVCRNMIDELIDQQNEAKNKPSYNNTERKLQWRTSDLKNLTEMLDHFMDNFYGYKTKKVEGKTTKQVLTTGEKKTKQELEKVIEDNAEAFANGGITEEEFIKNDKALQKQLVKLGGVRSWGHIADGLIKYFQVKGIGWNVFSAFANRGFGKISNWVDAAGGQRFTQKQLRKATTLMQHTILKNYSFHTYNPEIAQKIKASMNKLDVLKESKNEIFQQKVTNMNKRFKFLSPYNMQSRGEYLNQGEVMIAIMMNTPMLIDGKESNLWEATQTDGTLVEGANLPENSRFENTDELIFNTKARIDEAIRTLHGNYDYENAPLMIKRTVLGRMFAQFRTWAFMGFYDRFGTEKDNKIAGFTKKGRYLSYATFFKEFGPIQGTLELTKNLARKLVFQNTKFDNLIEDGVFTETDAANMRKNLQEIVLYMIITGIGLTMRAALIDEDDDSEGSLRYLATFWINQMGRLKTDILFYTNPMEFEKLQRQALPIFNLVQDSGRLLSHGFKLAAGQTTDFYETGIYAHERKSTRYMKNVFPFLNQINKLESVSKQLR